MLSYFLLQLKSLGIFLLTNWSVVSSKSTDLLNLRGFYKIFMKKTAIISSFLVVALSGCANSDLYSGDVYQAGQAKRVQSVSYGTVINARPILIQGENKVDLFGGLAGAVVGGVAGSTVGGGKGKDLATVAGAVGGAMAGEKLADKLNQIKGIELEIEQDDNKGRIIVVQKNDPKLSVGQRVRVVNDGQRVSVSVV
ncbi:MAG: glycine zipper 2TM domain-containing protein [Candidatus Symbiodolus clandestinus]